MFAGNFDRATKELKINMNGSFDDRRYTSLNNKQCEETLMERIADAMQDYNPVVETDGKFSDQRRSIVHRTRSGIVWSQSYQFRLMLFFLLVCSQICFQLNWIFSTEYLFSVILFSWTFQQFLSFNKFYNTLKLIILCETSSIWMH